jgi:hypothetical protein
MASIFPSCIKKSYWMAFFTSSIFIPNLAERNPSMLAHGFVFLILLSVASSSFFEEKVSIPDVKMAIVLIKNNFKMFLQNKKSLMFFHILE